MRPPATRTRILFMSTCPPTECGIATYTNDLINGINAKFGKSIKCLNADLTEDKSREDKAWILINKNFKQDFSKAARKVNEDDSISMVHIQHEFGLFGGNYGDYLLEFLEIIKKPVILTFHSVLPNPSEDLKKTVQRLALFTSGIIVMTKKSAEILEKDYLISPNIIEVIPHGTHLIRWVETKTAKQKLGLHNRLLFSTFGLLGPGKGIETALKALPEITKNFPKAMYLILGKTHPNLIKNGKDEYRDYLKGLVDELQIKNHVIFIDRYLELEELLDFLKATDIYLFTSKDPNQAVSGTFAYAMSCGCPIIATSIPHTREILTPELGFIIDIGDHQQLASNALELLKNPKMREAMSVMAFRKTYATAWENIAVKTVKLYSRLPDLGGILNFDFPEIKLDHIQRLTTSDGIIQFSKICIPDLESGFTLDDNARALTALAMHYEIFRDIKDLQYIDTYLSFVESCQQPDGRFVNYLDPNFQIHIQNGYVNLEDSNARAAWALGYVGSMKDILPKELVKRAEESLAKYLTHDKPIDSPRALGFSIKGLYAYSKNHKDSLISEQIISMAERLLYRYNLNRSSTWRWFEDYMTYANSILPEAMLYAYLFTGKEVYKEVALESLDFLLSHMFIEGQFKVISNRGWLQKGKKPKRYGEQPIDVSCTIQTLDKFYQTFGNPNYKNIMKTAFSWFLGNNHLYQTVYNPLTGGCCDGLEKGDVNINQGAESVVCYLLARLTVEPYLHNNAEKNFPLAKKIPPSAMRSKSSENP